LLDLQNGGLFRAVVLQREGNNVLLDTAFGKLSGQAHQTLHKGDEILARVVANGDQPRLEVAQRSSPILTLKNNTLQQTLAQQGYTPVAATVARDKAGNTLLQINNQSVAIGKQTALGPGQTVLLRPTADGKIQLLQVVPQPMLKAALSALLPRATKLPAQYNLSTLQRFSADLQQADRGALLARANTKAAELPARAPATPGPANPQVSTNASTHAANRGDTPQTQVLTQLLANLARPLADVAKIQPQVLQQLLATLAPTKNLPQQPSLTGNLLGLYRELKESPESLRQVVRHIFQAQAASATQTMQAERPLIELGNTLRLELLQQTEQTLNQLLTQHTSTRLQIEQNLPLQWHLNIPLMVDQETRNLALSLRQKKARANEQEEPAWEVELSFEFGLLGLITTRIQLNQKKISANFWSQLESTRLLIDQNLDSFRTQLHRAGFEPEHFESYLGKAPQNEERAEFPINENLVDLEA
jgi:hypothetical protein